MMSGIRGKNTKPELLLRSSLHRAGFRFRLHDRHLPGRPDLVFPKHRAVVFVHGCFWHAHEGCRYFKVPSTRQEFWRSKFSANRRRDARDIQSLDEQGWRIGVVWECATREAPDLSVQQVAEWLTSDVKQLEVSSGDR